MPTYLGPYDVVVVDGKEYHRGDTISASQARLAELRAAPNRYRFDGDDAANAAPVLANEPDAAHAPNEFGVPQDPSPRSNAAKAAAAAATPSDTATSGA